MEPQKNCVLGVYGNLLISILLFMSIIAIFNGINLSPVKLDAFSLVITLVVFIILSLNILESKRGAFKYGLYLLWLSLLAYMLYPTIKKLSTTQIIQYIGLTLGIFLLITTLAHLYPLKISSKINRTELFLLAGLILAGLAGSFIFKSISYNRLYYISVVAIFSLFLFTDTQRYLYRCQKKHPIDIINIILALVLDIVNIFNGIVGIINPSINNTILNVFIVRVTLSKV